MILPQVHGQNTQEQFYIYAACDSAYFNQFAPALINSTLTNTAQGLHLHLFNPTDEQIRLCNRPRISATWEYVSLGDFLSARDRWLTASDEQQRRTKTAMTKSNITDVQEQLMRTYFACARFIRLYQQFREPVFAIDVDAVVRRPIPKLPSDVDLHLHRIFGKKARCLAGGLYLNNTATNFIKAYATELADQIEQDYLYWGVDQDILDRIVPLYQHGQLPAELIDWEMQESGIIWTAKGTRKDTEIFISEQQKYIS